MGLKDKIKIEALLNTYSVKDISNTFMQIDNRLMSLHECSTKDFLHLNSNFKNLFKQSKDISENIDSISDIFNRDINIDLYNQIRNFCIDFNTHTNTFEKKTFGTIALQKSISEKFSYLFFPVKNLAQDLMILKYLLANLTLLAPIDTSTPKEFNFDKNRIKEISEEITKNLKNLKKISSVSYSNHTQTKKYSSIKLLNILENIETKIDNLERKFVSNKNCIHRIRNKYDKSESNISDIVKKLQYNDIINQKMGHVQKTHSDLINELSMLNDKNDDANLLLEKAKFLLKIRDIAGLQAAQLIQANKEYQKAIEIIINNFMQVVDNMDVKIGVCGDRVIDKESQEVKLYNDILEHIDGAEEIFNKQYDQNEMLNKEIIVTNYQLAQAEDYFDELKKLNQELSNKVNLHLKNIEECSTVDDNLKKSIIQIKTVFTEINNSILTLEEVIKKLRPLKSQLEGIVAGHGNLEMSINFKQIKGLVEQLQLIRKKVDVKLDENQEISNRSLKHIKTAISEIKYYDYFEKTIEEIINELNTINHNLNSEKDFEDVTFSENLSTLKENYTIETEHSIHEQVTKGEEINVESTDDGDIEFF